MYNAALKLRDEHLPVLAYSVPMGPEYDLRVEDWLWHGYHDRQHTDDIRRALELDWRPEPLTFVAEIEATLRTLTRRREGAVRAAYSIAEEAWEEESALAGWTYKDILTHLATNDIRHEIRLRAALGEGDAAELRSLDDVDGWNERARQERRGLSVRELIDEMAARRQGLMRLLSRLRPEHMSAAIALPDGRTFPPAEYIEMFSGHEARHAGQLIPASRARRWHTA
jgi:hypothetical protein